MDKNEIQYESFLNEVHPANRGFAEQINAFFLQNGCKIKIEAAKNGYVVSYIQPKTKKTIANFVFRKAGLLIRIYGDNYDKYTDLISGLPPAMLKAIDKSSNCKRLLDPAKCNSRCPMGYDFIVGENHFKKCRYGCFMFLINDENMPSIMEILENEVRERAAV